MISTSPRFKIPWTASRSKLTQGDIGIPGTGSIGRRLWAIQKIRQGSIKWRRLRIMIPHLQMIDASPRAQIALAWGRAFKNWDLPAIYGLMTKSPDFRYCYLPASAGMAPKSLEEYKAYNRALKRVLPDFKVCWFFILSSHFCVF